MQFELRRHKEKVNEIKYKEKSYRIHNNNVTHE